ncbi:MAG: hypothetical protein M3Z32_08785 [Acidobacteriota bacterium]|nr:hypothetical protein [Acidobacteriota bacterium]
MRCISVTLLLLLQISITPLNAGELSPAARQAFSRYVQLFETTWKQGNFDVAKFRARRGELLVWQRVASRRENNPSGALIQDWTGLVFLPGTNIEHVRSMMQDYPNYKVYFKPEVTESKLIRRQGDDFEVFLRLCKKHILSVVLNTTYSIHYASSDARHMSVISRSTRVAEVRDAGQRSEAEEPPGSDSGYLWVLNSYWQFEEADGGVYAECDAISLSRDVPFGLGWAVKGFLDRFPKESMQNTLAGVKRAVLERPR